MLVSDLGAVNWLWSFMVLSQMHFLDFLVFLQKTLSAHISAPRRGREAIQHSKSSPVLTNIIQHLRKHIKGTRASGVSLIENFEKFQIFPFWTQTPIFLYEKGGKWV